MKTEIDQALAKFKSDMAFTPPELFTERVEQLRQRLHHIVAQPLCGQHHVFPRDRFAGAPRAEVWCTNRRGHVADGEPHHDAVKNGTAYTWQDTP